LDEFWNLDREKLMAACTLIINVHISVSLK